MSIESVMSSSHLILCHSLLPLPSIFPSIRVFSTESVLHIRWPKYWSFSFNISPSGSSLFVLSIQEDFQAEEPHTYIFFWRWTCFPWSWSARGVIRGDKHISTSEPLFLLLSFAWIILCQMSVYLTPSLYTSLCVCLLRCIQLFATSWL